MVATNLGDIIDNSQLESELKKTYTVYSKEEVLKHSYEADAWVVVDESVFNVTQFLEKHPGGKEIMLPHLGNDATEIFHSETPHSHSKYAIKMLQKYKIGVIENTSKSMESGAEQDYWDSLVDLSKPIVMQIIKLSPPSIYQKWLDRVTQPLTVRLFETDLLEAVSRWPWWYIFVMWIPVILYMLQLSFVYAGVLKSSVNFLFGIFVWTISEYVIHRFGFHVETETIPGNFYHFFAHGAHHLFPMDKTRLTFPPFFSAALALGIYFLFDKLSSPFSGWQAIYAGIVMAYMMYDALHYYFHHGSPFWETIPILGEYLSHMKTLHLNHHFKNHNKNFGVTSPIWDFVFGTYV